MRHATATMVTLVLLLHPSSKASGEATRPSPAVSLPEVVGSLLVNGTEVKLARLEAENARGTLLVAAEPFDTAWETTLTGSQDQSFAERPDAATEIRRFGFTTGLSKRFRRGLVVAPEVSSSRSIVAGAPSLTIGEASARLRLLLPLLRDRGGVLTGGPEESARRHHAASLLQARHTVAQGVLEAATSYWDYLAALRRLEVLLGSEGRAERTARETGALVKADERTRTERVQAEGHLAASRASRFTAEQEAMEAWERLATAMGITREDLSTLPPASTEFPGPGQEPSADSLHRWLKVGTRLRDDLRASDLRLEGTAVAEKAAGNELLPRLDLELSAGYKGQELDRGWGRFIAPLHQQPPGLDGLIQLHFALPLVRSGARGRVTQAEVAIARQRLLREHTERTIRNAVAVALQIVKRSQLALRESQEAVRLLTQTVESERQKFRLGFSTLFAVIQAEEQLTSAQLGMIAGQRSFAVAIARSRFETGTLLDPAGAGEPAESSPQVAAGLLLLP